MLDNAAVYWSKYADDMVEFFLARINAVLVPKLGSQGTAYLSAYTKRVSDLRKKPYGMIEEKDLAQVTT